MAHRSLCVVSLVFGAIGTSAFAQVAGTVSAVNPGSAVLSCTMTRAEAEASGAAFVAVGERAIFAGFRQVSANDRNPLVLAFEGDSLLWCREDYDTTGFDVSATGVLWDGGDLLFCSFRVAGFPGASSGLVQAAAAGNGWQAVVSNAGNARIGGLFALSPDDGALADTGTFLVSRLSSGAANLCEIEGLAFCDDGDLLVYTASGFSPLRPDLSRMTNTGAAASPTPYRVRLAPDLTTAVAAQAIGFDSVAAFASALDSCPIPPNTAGACPADTNNDGLVTPADYNAWILAYNNQAPECDQNGDGLCTPADYNGWILNYNTGCP